MLNKNFSYSFLFNNIFPKPFDSAYIRNNLSNFYVKFNIQKKERFNKCTKIL